MIDQRNQERRVAALEASPDCQRVFGTIDVAIPVDRLWAIFQRAHLWSRWNDCFFWVQNTELVLDATLVWAFNPIRPAYLYRMPAWARIVELEAAEKVTWEVTALPGMYARHTYFMSDIGGGKTRFGSSEKAMGASYRVMKRFWDAHFWFVNRRSLAGARMLEQLYQRDGSFSSLLEGSPS